MDVLVRKLGLSNYCLVGVVRNEEIACFYTRMLLEL
jgi:hypothetical protein